MSMLIHPADTLTRPPIISNDKVAVARWTTSFTLTVSASGSVGM